MCCLDVEGLPASIPPGASFFLSVRVSQSKAGTGRGTTTLYTNIRSSPQVKLSVYHEAETATGASLPGDPSPASNLASPTPRSEP